MKKLYKCEWNITTNEKKLTLIREDDFSAKVFFSVDVNDNSTASFKTIQHSYRNRYDKEKSMNVVNRDGSFLVLLKTSNWYDSPSSTSSSTLVFRQNMNAEAKSTDIENLQLRKILCITETPEGYGILIHGKYEKNGTLSEKSLILLRIDKKGNPIALTPVVDKSSTSSTQLKYIIENCTYGFGEMIYNDAKGTLMLLDNAMHRNNFYTINFKL